MDASTTSFVYDRPSAVKSLRQGDPERLVPALLAGIAPRADWEGTVVAHGPSPLDGPSNGNPPRTVCVIVQGPAADELQRLLVEACERFGVLVVELYEGGPASSVPIARAEAGRWVSP